MEFFDPSLPATITARRDLPHWSQPGALTFITWRTFDSLPKAVLDSWRSDRNRWLRLHGIDPFLDRDWKTSLENLALCDRRHFHKTFTSRWHDHLDAGQGSCPLRDPSLSQIVADSLQYFDGERYEIRRFVIMPNHVHLLATFATQEAMLKQCESWKRFTARSINDATNRSGRFWQKDAFDHIVRSDCQLDYLDRYIATNPIKANLKPTEYRLK